MPKFVPLGDVKTKKYWLTRREALKKARKALKGFGYSGLACEDSNKISFSISSDISFRELMHMLVEFEKEIDAVDDIQIEAGDRCFWVIVGFESDNFPLGKKDPYKTVPRLRGG